MQFEVLTAIALNLVALGTAFLGAVKFYSEIKAIASDQSENLRQIKALWKKIDKLDQLADCRLDRIERQLNYLAGMSRLDIDKIEGHHD